jgi:hypothetical protein
MGASAAAAAIIAKEKHIVAAFRSAQATSPEAAVAPGDLGIGERVAFRRLREHGVLREARAGIFYVDEARWAALEARRRKIALIVLSVAVLGILVAILLSFVTLR